jgi:hypothetical protein
LEYCETQIFADGSSGKFRKAAEDFEVFDMCKCKNRPGESLPFIVIIKCKSRFGHGSRLRAELQWTICDTKGTNEIVVGTIKNRNSGTSF